MLPEYELKLRRVRQKEHVTMSLRSGNSKVAKISREMHPYIQYPLGAGYLNAGLPPAAPPPIAAGV